MKKQILIMALVLVLAAFAGAGTKVAVTRHKDNQTESTQTIMLMDDAAPLGAYGESEEQLQADREAEVAEAIINGTYADSAFETTAAETNVGVGITGSDTASVPQVEYFSQEELFSAVTGITGDKVVTGGTVYTYDETQKSFYAASETEESVSFTTDTAAVYANGEGHIKMNTLGSLDTAEFQLAGSSTMTFARVEHYDDHGNISSLFYYSMQDSVAEYAEFAWQYDGAGNPTDVTVTVRSASNLENMTGGTADVMTYLCDSTLDSDGRLSAVTIREGSGMIMGNLQYFYGDEGQVTRYVSGISKTILPFVPEFDAVVTWDENGDLLSAGNFTTLTVYDYAEADICRTDDAETLTQGVWVLDLESAGYSGWFSRFSSVDAAFDAGHVLLILNNSDVLAYRGTDETYPVVRDAENPDVLYIFAPGTTDTTDTSGAKMTVTYNPDTDMLDVVSGSSTYSLRRW